MDRNSIVGVIFFLAIILVLGYLFVNKEANNESQENLITMNFKFIDKNSKAEINNLNITLVKDQAKLREISYKDEWLGVNLEDQKNYTFFLEKDGYYSTINKLTATISNEKLEIQPQGQLVVSHTGSLNNEIDLEIRAIGKVNNLNLCSFQTLGFIDIDIPEHTSYCYSNWSKLKDKIYTCGELTQHCKETKDNNSICILENRIPERHKDKVNKCINIGKNLENDKITIPITTRVWQLTTSDLLTFYVIDEDLVFDNNFYYDFEKNKEDNGVKDIVYTIR